MKKNFETAIINASDEIAKVELMLLTLSNETRFEWKISGLGKFDWDKRPQVRLTTGSMFSKAVSAKHFEVAITDLETIEKIKKCFDRRYLTALFEMLTEVELNEKNGSNAPFSIEDALQRWEKYFSWLEEHYPQFGKSETWLLESSHPDNLAAWAARVILGGVKPSKIGLQLLREGRVAIGEDGYLRLTGKERSIYDFSHEDPCNSVGSQGSKHLTGGAFKCVFKAHESRVCETTKVPEDWEIKMGLFKGLTTQKGIYF